jgi:hypothetical protein
MNHSENNDLRTQGTILQTAIFGTETTDNFSLISGC